MKPLLPAARPALAVFALLFGIYLLTTGGHLYAIDEETMFAATESLSLHGTFVIGGSNDAPAYSRYGPGQSIAAVPFYLVGRGLAAFWPADAYEWLTRVAVSWFNPMVTAGVAALLVQAVAQLGYSRRTAVATAMLYGLGTMAWPHSKTFFAEPLTTLVVFTSFVLILRATTIQMLPANACPIEMTRTPPTSRMLTGLFLAGVLAGTAPTVKIQAGIVLPILGLYLLARLAANRRAWHEGIIAAAVWGAGAFVPLVLLGAYQYVLFGNALQTGYGAESGGFTTPFWEGFNGQLWSPGRGIIWYAPITLLFPVGLWLLRRSHRAVAVLCAAFFMAHILFYATWWAWDGAGAWGPRFLNVTLPFVVLPLAAFLETVRRYPLRRFALILLLAVTLPVQLAGLLINLNSFFSLTRGQAPNYYQVADSAIVGHWRLTLDYAGRLYNRYFAPETVALRSGFSYSEGGVQSLPRWTHDVAEIGLRSGSAEPVTLLLVLNSCSAAVPVRVGIALDGHLVVPPYAVCPARQYHVLVPAGNNRLTLSATPWNPAQSGSERDETLGVWLGSLQATVDGRLLTVRGDQIPPTLMPKGHNTIRYWMSDHRIAHWDFWWWYMQHTPYPVSYLLALAAVWLAVAFGAIGYGMWATLKL